MELWENIVRMVTALGLVLALMLGLLAIARSAIGRRWLPMQSLSALRVVGSCSVGSRKDVLLVAVAGEVLILGSTANDLVPLGKVGDPEQVKRLLADPSTGWSPRWASTQVPQGTEESSRAAS